MSLIVFYLCCLSPNSLISLIDATIMCYMTVPVHFNHQQDYILLFKLSRTSILMELSSKQIFNFSLNFLTLPIRVHLKKSGHIEIWHSISEKFSSLNHILHSPIMEPLQTENIYLPNYPKKFEQS